MKSCLALLVLFAPAVAFAQPAPQYLVAPSLEIGGNTPQKAIIAGFAVDGGYRLSGDFWLHGKGLVAAADASQWGNSRPTGNVETLGAGVEWRHRWLIAGVDGTFVHDGNPSGDVARYTGPALAGHAGLELGSGHVRFRPTFEMMVGTSTHLPNTIVTKNYALGGLSLGVAFVW